MDSSHGLRPSGRKIKFLVRNLSFYYGSVQALKSINVPIYDKEVTALIGPSGCGKSTLLRAFNRMYELYPNQKVSGQILMNGQDILGTDQNVTRLRAKVGMVFQRPTPFPMSIFENVAFGIRLHENLRAIEVEERVRSALERAALWSEVKDKLKFPGSSLSGGQQQRLCIARAIAVRPEVILLDEPTSALDPISTGLVEELINELKEEYCVVLVTHNMQQASRVSNTTGFMYLAELVEIGPTSMMFTKPQNKLTEEYITGRFG